MSPKPKRPRHPQPATTPPSGARHVAARVLERVAREGAYATPALDAEIGRAGLDARDARLATAIVYGTLRVLPELDAAIAASLTREGKLDSYVHALLRTAFFQLRYLPRVPARAVLHESAELARARGRGKGAAKLAGFVNAVLRRQQRELGDDLGEREVRMVLPEWVKERLDTVLDAERLAALGHARELPPSTDLRVLGDRAALVERIREARPDAEITLGEVSDRCVRIRRGGDPRQLPGHDEGAFAVQEEGAQLIGALVGASPGQKVADTCAGRGGKTTDLAAAVGAEGTVLALELHERRLEQIAAAFARLGLQAALDARTVDLRVGTGGACDDYDHVLVDAPCTGLGTVHRRPEILLRLDMDDVLALQQTQTAILAQAAKLVRPGGDLIYVVCSPLPEEGRDVADGFDTEHPSFARAPFTRAELGELSEDPDGVLRLGPWLAGGGTDGYQVVRWRRIS